MTGYQIEHGGVPSDIAEILAEKRARAEKFGIGIHILRAEGSGDALLPEGELVVSETGVDPEGPRTAVLASAAHAITSAHSRLEAGHTFQAPTVTPLGAPSAPKPIAA